jgi:hypothetical protein
MTSDPRFTRGYAVDETSMMRDKGFGEHDMRRGGGEYADSRDEQFRGREIRVSTQSRRLSPGSDQIPSHSRDTDSFSPHPEDPTFRGPHSVQFREERFTGRPENRRMHASRTTNIHSARADPSSDSPRLSPRTLRNDAPLPPRHEFIPSRDTASAHIRGRNGEMRDRGPSAVGDRDAMVLHQDSLPLDHESMVVAPEERELRALDPRQGDRFRQHHRHSASRGEYMAVDALSPQNIHERHLSKVSPPRRAYTNRARDFPPQAGTERRDSELSGERDFRPRDTSRFPPKEHRNRNGEQHDSYPRGSHPQDPPPHVYDSSPLTRTGHMPVHDVDTVPSARVYPPTEPQRQEPSSGLRETYSRRYGRDDRYFDRTSRTWERGVEVPTPPEEGQHGSRRHQSDNRRPQRQAVSDTEYVESRTSGRSRRPRDGNSGGYDDMEGEARYKRHTPRDGKLTYDREDRQWTPRDALQPQLQDRSQASRMDMDVREGPLATPSEPLPGWTGFHRRDRSPEAREHAHSYRPRVNPREAWPPATEVEQEMVGTENGVEGGKRQKMEGGTKMINTFSREDDELRKYNSIFFSL